VVRKCNIDAVRDIRKVVATGLSVDNSIREEAIGKEIDVIGVSSAVGIITQNIKGT
jgi:hypothetical protein